jgi:hypothetical protein
MDLTGVVDLYYVFLKLFFVYGLVRVFLKFDVLQDHVLLMAILYTVGIGFLSWVYFNWRPNFRLDNWELWLARTGILAWIYFWLLSKYGEGIMLYILLLAGLGLVYF